MDMTTQQLIQNIQQLHRQVVLQQPLVQCITNSVATNFSANVLLAAHASPAMIDNPHEAGVFAQLAGAVNINTGTPTDEQTDAMLIATKSAHENHTPWVLDPVGYGAMLAWRSQTVDQLLLFKPNIIRGNASEIETLAGGESTGKGVDSTRSSQAAVESANVLLKYTPCVAISGETDYIISEKYGVVAVYGGSALQPKITAMGCALGAICAAYHALTDDSALAAIAAHLHFAVAGQKAEQKAKAVGSFQVAFLDELYTLKAEDFNEQSVALLSQI